MTVSINDLREMLTKEIDSAFTSSDDKSFDDIFVDIAEDLIKKGYDVSCKVIQKGRWVSDGKYDELEDAVVKVIIDNEAFFVGVCQSRSGSSFTDYYYNEAYISFLMTEAEYNAPVVKYTFEYKGKKVSEMSDGTAQVDSKSFSSVEAAIDSILSSMVK